MPCGMPLALTHLPPGAFARPCVRRSREWHFRDDREEYDETEGWRLAARAEDDRHGRALRGRAACRGADTRPAGELSPAPAVDAGARGEPAGLRRLDADPGARAHRH